MPRIRDFIATQVPSTGEANNITVNLPVHQSGDLLVMFVCKDDTLGGAFGTPSGWTKGLSDSDRTVGTSGNNSLRSAYFYKFAASSSETDPNVTSTDVDSWTAIAVSIEGAHASPIDVDGSNTDTSGPPYTCNGVTTNYDNSLILYGCHTDGGVSPVCYPQSGALWLTTEDSAANAQCLAYKFQKTAGATGNVDFYATSTADDSAMICVAIRDDGTGDYIQSYLSSGWGTLVDPLKGNGNPLGGSWPISLSVATIGSKTTSYDAIGNVADSGVSPYENAANITPAQNAASTLLGGSQKNLGSNADLSSGFLVGTYRFATPRDYIDMGRISEGGGQICLADASNNYRSWIISAFKAVDVDKDGRSVFVIQTDQGTSTAFAESGTAPTMSAIDKVLLLSTTPRGAMALAFNQLIKVSSTGLVVNGGSSTNPITYGKFEQFLGLPYPLQLAFNGNIRVPVTIGGADAVHVGWDLFVMRFPKRYNETDFYVLSHVDVNGLGLYIDARSGDTCKLTNGIIISDTSYDFEFLATASNGATYDFSGLAVVNANVILRPVTTFSGVVFNSCSEIVHNGADLSGGGVIIKQCRDTTAISISSGTHADNLAGVSFENNTNGHSITITATGTYDFDGIMFSGGGADTTTTADVYNNSGGSVTINILGGGDTPTIRNGAGASTTVQNSVTLTVTVKNESAVNVQGARVRISQQSDSSLVAEGTTNSSGVFTSSYNYTTSNPVDIIVRLKGYIPFSTTGTITSAGLDVNVRFIKDTIVD